MSGDKRATEAARLEALCDVWDDQHPEKTGVLLSDAISLYAEDAQMILPFSEENLKPAGYELTVGDEAMLGGEHIRLDGVDQELRIPPFEVAVVKTAETINLPRFIIARWNIRVRWAYKGLLWVGGPQVDPGFVGHLFCPLYNLSNEPVKLKKGEPIALMDFVKTSKVDFPSEKESKLEKYRRPPKRILMEDYGVDEFKSALYSQDEEVKDGLAEVKRKVEVFSTFTFIVIAILMSLMTLPYLSDDSPRIDRELTDHLTLVVASFAVLISLFGLSSRASSTHGPTSNSRKVVGWLKREWWKLAVVGIMYFVIGAVVYPFRFGACCCSIW